VDTVSVDGWSEKSIVGAATGLTGARTAGEPETMTGISVECEVTPFVAVTSSV